ncbi:hypothetical protein VQ056_21085 [Paenibacillus sp. JTLBN-2024]
MLDGHALGSSEIEADAGSLQLRMNGIEEGGSLTARTDVGSIRASFADTMKYTLQAESDLGRSPACRTENGSLTGRSGDFASDLRRRNYRRVQGIIRFVDTYVQRFCGQAKCTSREAGFGFFRLPRLFEAMQKACG